MSVSIDAKGNVATELMVLIEMPALQLATQFSFAVKPSKQCRILDGIEEVVGIITHEFSEDLLNVDESATQRKLEMLRKKVIADAEEWNQKLRTAEDWKMKAHRAGEQMNRMRDAYFKEISCLREQVFQKQKNEKDGVEFKPVDLRSFDPDAYTLVDPNAERQKLVDDLKDEHSKEMKLAEEKFNNKISHLQDQLATTKMVLSRKEKLMDQYQVSLVKAKQRETHSEQVNDKLDAALMVENASFAHIAVQTSVEDFDTVNYEDAPVYFRQAVCAKLGVPLPTACDKLISLFSPSDVLSGACIARLIEELGFSHDPLEFIWSFMSCVNLPMHDLLRRLSKPEGSPIVDEFLRPVEKRRGSYAGSKCSTKGKGMSDKFSEDCSESDDSASSAEMKRSSVMQQRRGSTGNMSAPKRKAPTKKRIDQGIATDIAMDCGIQAAFTECSGVLRDTKEVGTDCKPFEQSYRRVELVSRAAQSFVDGRMLDQAEKYFDDVAESNWNDLVYCSEESEHLNEPAVHEPNFKESLRASSSEGPLRSEGMFSSHCEGDNLGDEEKEPSRSLKPITRTGTFVSPEDSDLGNNGINAALAAMSGETGGKPSFQPPCQISSSNSQNASTQCEFGDINFGFNCLEELDAGQLDDAEKMAMAIERQLPLLRDYVSKVMLNENAEQDERERAATLLEQIQRSTPSTVAPPVQALQAAGVSLDAKLSKLTAAECGDGALSFLHTPETVQGMLNRFRVGTGTHALVQEQDGVDVQDAHSMPEKRSRPPTNPTVTPRVPVNGRRSSIPNKTGGPNQLKPESSIGPPRRPTTSSVVGSSSMCSVRHTDRSLFGSNNSNFSCGSGTNNLLGLSIGGPPEDSAGPAHVEERSTYGKGVKDIERSGPQIKIHERNSESNLLPPPGPPKRPKLPVSPKVIKRGSSTEFVCDHIKGLGNASDMAIQNDSFSSRHSFQRSECSFGSAGDRLSGDSGDSDFGYQRMTNDSDRLSCISQRECVFGSRNRVSDCDNDMRWEGVSDCGSRETFKLDDDMVSNCSERLSYAASNRAPGSLPKKKHRVSQQEYRFAGQADGGGNSDAPILRKKAHSPPPNKPCAARIIKGNFDEASIRQGALPDDNKPCAARIRKGSFDEGSPRQVVLPDDVGAPLRIMAAPHGKPPGSSRGPKRQPLDNFADQDAHTENLSPLSPTQCASASLRRRPSVNSANTPENNGSAEDRFCRGDHFLRSRFYTDEDFDDDHPADPGPRKSGTGDLEPIGGHKPSFRGGLQSASSNNVPDDCSPPTPFRPVAEHSGRPLPRKLFHK